MPAAIRETMEARFGTDFGSVRVHAGPAAGNLAGELGARAFTYGRDVWFRSAGDLLNSRLVAHELTHVLQQRGNPASRMVARDPPDTVEEAPSATTLAGRFMEYALGEGQGYYLSGNLGITPVIPVYISEETQVYIHRRQGYIHILYRNRGQVNLDLAIGAGIGLGRRRRGGGGGGESGANTVPGIGAELGANVGAGADAVVIQEYRIPIDEFGDYLVDRVGSRLQDLIVSTATPGAQVQTTFQEAFSLTLRGMAEGGRLDAYEIRRQVEFGLFAEGAAEATLGLRDLSQREAAEGYTRGGERPRGVPRLGLPGQGATEGERQDVRTRNQMYVVNRLLMPSLRLAAHLRLSAGYEQNETSEADAHTSDLRIYLQGEGTLELPILGILPIIGSGGGGVALNIRTRSTEAGDRIVTCTAQVYHRTGDLDYHAGSASETRFSFNLGQVLSQAEIERLLAGDSSVLGQARGGLPERLGRAFEGVELRVRQQIGGQWFHRFNRFVRRHGGGARILISDTNRWQDATTGLDISGWLTATFRLSGPNLVRVFRILAPEVANATGRTVGALATRGRISDAFEALRDYVTEFALSEERGELEGLLLDGVSVTEAALRFSMGAGIAGQVRLRAGVGVRLGGYLEAGTFCERDLLQVFGGALTLRAFGQRMGDVLEDPIQYLPDCGILQAMRNVLAGERYERVRVRGRGRRQTDRPAEHRPRAQVVEADPDAQGRGTPARDPETQVRASPTDEPIQDAETQPRILSYALRWLGSPEEGRAEASVRFEQGGEVIRAQGIPLRVVERSETGITFELDAERPHRISPPGVTPAFVVPIGWQIERMASEVLPARRPATR